MSDFYWTFKNITDYKQDHQKKKIFFFFVKPTAYPIPGSNRNGSSYNNEVVQGQVTDGVSRI